MGQKREGQAGSRANSCEKGGRCVLGEHEGGGRQGTGYVSTHGRLQSPQGSRLHATNTFKVCGAIERSRYCIYFYLLCLRTVMTK